MPTIEFLMSKQCEISKFPKRQMQAFLFSFWTLDIERLFGISTLDIRISSRGSRIAEYSPRIADDIIREVCLIAPKDTAPIP
jgi:hypothetical protein